MQAWEEKILERREAREEGLKEGLAKGLKKGRDEGLKTGRRKEKFKIAKGLRESNIPIDIIAKNTGLSKEEIEAL